MNNVEKKMQYLIVFTMILLGILGRLLPHPYNFTPIAAIALFAAVYLPKKIAFILPAVIMFISDIFLGFYEPYLMIAVYGSFLACTFIGFWLKKNKKWQTLLGCSIFCSVVFFLATNFAVWAFTPWYAKTIPGLMQSFTMALPFFRNTLLGDLTYVALFFMIFENAGVWVIKKTSAKFLLAKKSL